jgi:hypothetical protein
MDRQVTIFHNDDAAFRDWLAAHRAGAVLNLSSGRHTTLHRADCHHIDITRGDAGVRWTTTPKVCASTEEQARNWLMEKRRSTPKRCPDC